MGEKLNREISAKLIGIRKAIAETGASGVRLRGTDWFAWATAGASHTVLLTAETGAAEVLITAEAAWVVSDEIEAPRLQAEELTGGRDEFFQLYSHPWTEAGRREAFVREVTAAGKVLSDRATSQEASLPSSLIAQKRVLFASECDRYRQVGRLASEAMTEVMQQAQPDWTEYQLAGAGAAALWSRGLHPALTLVAGAERLPRYRHPTPTNSLLGQQAMMVFCARGYGLYANLTRFVSFGPLSPQHQHFHQQIREIEAAALDQCQIGMPLQQVYSSLKQNYEQQGYSQAIREHHQGGTTGYLAREIVATPETTAQLQANMAIAWNPSLRGVKIEDTFVILENGQLENLTLDPQWPRITVNHRPRPLPLEMR